MDFINWGYLPLMISSSGHYVDESFIRPKPALAFSKSAPRRREKGAAEAQSLGVFIRGEAMSGD